MKVNALHKHNGNYNAQIKLSFGARKNLKWWARIIHNTSAPIHHDDPVITMYTDASYYGWGAVCGKFRAQGKFLPHELHYSISTKECLAIYYGFKSFLHLFEGKHVLIRSDNTTAVSFVKKMGGMSCHIRDHIMSNLWKLTTRNNCWISITHIPGKINIAADWASRLFNDRTEWALKQHVFDKINEHFGPLQIDLFASTNNAKLPKFVSWHPDPDCWTLDTFTFSWRGLQAYVFPPFSLLIRCLEKIQHDIATCTIVAPLWPGQNWFPILLNMMIDFPLLLPNPPLLYLPWEPQATHPMAPKMQLFSIKVSGNHYDVQEFHKLLASTSPHQRGPQHNHTTDVFSLHGKNFVINNHLVPVIHL